MGGVTGVIAGGGIAGTLAALPMPLGSLTEPLSPRAFAGPGGMPLTPASWAGDLPGAARRPRTATLRNATLPIIHPREKIETSCARLIIGDHVSTCHILGENLQDSPEVPMVGGQSASKRATPFKKDSRPLSRLAGCMR